MQPDGTPPQPEARQTDDFPAQPLQHGPVSLSPGECGDAIWECLAYQGGAVDAGLPAPPDAAQPGGRETGICGGRFINLAERRPRQDQVEG